MKAGGCRFESYTRRKLFVLYLPKCQLQNLLPWVRTLNPTNGALADPPERVEGVGGRNPGAQGEMRGEGGETPNRGRGDVGDKCPPYACPTLLYSTAWLA